MEKKIEITKDLVGRTIKVYRAKSKPNVVYNKTNYPDLSNLVIGKISNIRPVRTQLVPKMYFDGFEFVIDGRDGKQYRMSTGKRTTIDFLD